MTDNYVPVFIYMAATLVLVAVIIGLSSLVGKKRVTKQKMMPYECGLDPMSGMEMRFPVRFYIVAMLFIIFDIETVFLYPWAVVYQSLGWFGFVEMLLFTLMLFAGLIYLYRKDALEWD